MTAQPIGEIAERILARCVAMSWLHDELRRIPDAGNRKRAILRAHDRGQIDAEATRDLIVAYQLETA